MGLWSKIKKAAKKVAEAIKDAAEKVAEAIEDTAKKVGEAIKVAAEKVWAAIKTAAEAIYVFARQYLNAYKDSLYRMVKAPAFILDLFAGCHGVRYLRLRILILRDEQGQAIVEEDKLEVALEEVRRVFRQEAEVEIIAGGPKDSPIIVTLDEPAPKEALDYHVGYGQDYGEAGDFFRKHSNLGTLPVYAFIVHDVIGDHSGYSLSVLTDYVVWDVVNGVNGDNHRRLAHEIAHACGLPEKNDIGNLMFAPNPGDQLTRWQVAIFRNSRHVGMLQPWIIV